MLRYPGCRCSCSTPLISLAARPGCPPVFSDCGGWPPAQPLLYNFHTKPPSGGGRGRTPARRDRREERFKE